MALQSSGPIALSNIQAEFGGTNPISMSEYYGKGGVAASGTLSLSAWYGAENRIYLSPNSSPIVFDANNLTAADGVSVTSWGNIIGNTGTISSIAPPGASNQPVMKITSALKYVQFVTVALHTSGGDCFYGDVNANLNYVPFQGVTTAVLFNVTTVTQAQTGTIFRAFTNLNIYDNRWNVDITTAKELRFEFNKGGNAPLHNAQMVVPFQKWNFAVCRQNTTSGKLEIFLNGIDAALTPNVSGTTTKTTASQWSNNAMVNNVVVNFSPGGYCSGLKLALVAVWTRSISDAELRGLFAGIPSNVIGTNI